MKYLHWTSILIILIIFPLFYFFSLSLLELYVNGDQIHYRSFYEAISTIPYSQAFILARGYIDAGEPLSIAALWIGSHLNIPKDHYISFFNAILLTLIVLTLRKYKAGLLVTFFFITNFYVIVLITGAERLKFAYILLVSAALFNGYIRNFLILLAPLAHFQSLLFMPSIFIARFYNNLKIFFSKGIIGKKELFISLSAVIFIFFMIFYLYPSLQRKGQAYLEADRGIIVILNLIILTLISIIASKDWKRMLILLLPCYPIIFLVGGERGNMIAITISLWILMIERRLNHPLILIMLAYFSWKSIDFIRKIIIFGNGFAAT